MEIAVLPPATRLSAFTPIRSRRPQFDRQEPAIEDVFDIEAEYRLVQTRPMSVPRSKLQRAADVVVAAATAFLIIGSSMFMLELPNQGGPQIVLPSLTGPLQAMT